MSVSDRPGEYVLVSEIVASQSPVHHSLRGVLSAYCPSCPLTVQSLVGRTFRVILIDEDGKLWLDEIKETACPINP